LTLASFAAIDCAVPSDFTQMLRSSADDIDELGHVNNAVWVRWMQDVAIAHWNAVADPAHIAAYVWVVTRHEIDYLGNVGPGEDVCARTWVGDPPKGARFDRHMEFANATGKIVVRARSTWAMIDRCNGRPARVTQAITRGFM
jgi:acyl-CoA thioester hydrolase